MVQQYICPAIQSRHKQSSSAICRVVLWILLFLAALFDTIRHRHIKRKGCQLQRGIVLSLFAYVVQDVLLLSYSVLDRDNSKDAPAVRRAYYVFSDLADSIFMVSPSKCMILLFLFVLQPFQYLNFEPCCSVAGTFVIHSCRILVSLVACLRCVSDTNI